MAKKKEKMFGLNPLTFLQRFLQGRSFLTLGFFRKFGVTIVCVTLMMLMYISQKYEAQNKLQEMMDMTTQLDNAKTDCVNASAQYNSMIRESQMKAFIDTMHIDLSSPEKPPYILSDK